MFADVLCEAMPGLSAELAERLEAYWKLVKKKNEVMNLTAVTDDEEAARRHFLDALALLRLAEFPQGASVVDVGSGAGFPGVPLKLARPDLRLCLLDSLGKRVTFLREALAEMGVEAECVHARAEEFALLPARRDGYDLAVSRAVARLNVLTELCLPLVKPGGAFLAMKTADAGEELREAERAIRTLGGELEDLREYEEGGARRAVAVIRKRRATPKGYPRRYAQIVKKPL